MDVVFTVRDVETADASQQELAPYRGHGVIKIYLHARQAQNFSSHQSSRPAADDGNVLVGKRGGRLGSCHTAILRCATIKPALNYELRITNEVIECTERCFSALAHGDNDLLVRYGGAIAGSEDADG